MLILLAAVWILPAGEALAKFPRVRVAVPGAVVQTETRFRRAILPRNRIARQRTTVFAGAPGVSVSVGPRVFRSGIRARGFNTFGSRTIVDANGNVFEQFVDGSVIFRGNQFGFAGFSRFGSRRVIVNSGFCH